MLWVPARVAMTMVGWSLASGIVPGGAPAHAAGAYLALVIGESSYVHEPELPSCRQLASRLASQLRQQGYDVAEVIDGSAAILRGAVEGFAERVGNTAAAEAMLYVCGSAVATGTRLFLLPVDADIRRPTELPTQAVLLKTFMRAATGSNAAAGPNVMFSGELSLRHGTDVAAAFKAIGETRSDRLHLALTAGEQGSGGAIAEAVIKAGPDLALHWADFVAALSARLEKTGGGATTVFLPPMPDMAASSGEHPVPAGSPPQPGDPKSPQAGSGQSVPAAAATTSAAPQAAVGQAQLGGVDIQVDALRSPAEIAPAPSVPVPPPAAPSLAPPSSAVAVSSATPPPFSAARPDHLAVAAPKPIAPTSARMGSALRTIRIKSALLARGFYVGPINAVEDASMQAAIRSFQKSRGDQTTGRLTAAEIVLLLNAE